MSRFYMTKEEIIQDEKFREACSKYGVNWENCRVFEFVIALKTPIDNLYILMDRYYDTFCIDKKKPQYGIETDLQSFVNEKFYRCYARISPFRLNSGCPFQEYTLENIIKLASRIEVKETNHGQSLCTQISGVWYNRDEEELEDYFKLLSYVKFLGEEIKQYFLLSYHMQVMGFEVPDVYAYVKQLISKINDLVDNYLSHYRRPYPKDILSYIGQNYREVDMNGILYDVIDLLMTDRGYQINSENPDLVSRISDLKETTNYSKLAKDLLRILAVTDEELKKEDKEKSLFKKLIYGFDSSY